jgi:hypothetical protein
METGAEPYGRADCTSMLDVRCRADWPPCMPTTSPLIPGTNSQTHPHNPAEAPPSPPSPSPPTSSSSSPASEVSLLPSSFATLTIEHRRFRRRPAPSSQRGLPPPLDIYTPSTDTWTTVYPAPDPGHGFLGPRSVHGLVPFTTGTHTNRSRPIPVALLCHGERDASSLGHAGVGVFWDDAWLLLATSTSGLQWKSYALVRRRNVALSTEI